MKLTLRELNKFDRLDLMDKIKKERPELEEGFSSTKEIVVGELFDIKEFKLIDKE